MWISIVSVSYLGKVFRERVFERKLLTTVWTSISDGVAIMVAIWQWSSYRNDAKKRNDLHTNDSLDIKVINDNSWIRTLAGGKARKEKARNAFQKPCPSNHIFTITMAAAMDQPYQTETHFKLDYYTDMSLDSLVEVRLYQGPTTAKILTCPVGQVPSNFHLPPKIWTCPNT